MSATRVYVPGQHFSNRCNIPGCDMSGAVAHHSSYCSSERWALVGLCPPHHETLHALFDLIKDTREVELPVFTLRYILSAEATARRVEAMLHRVPRRPEHLIPEQLSFADIMGHSGDYWRRLWATETRPIDELPHDDEAPPKAA